MSKRYFFVGCGKMGSALLHHWLKAGMSPQAFSIRTQSDISAEQLISEYGVKAEPGKDYHGEDVILRAASSTERSICDPADPRHGQRAKNVTQLHIRIVGAVLKN